MPLTLITDPGASDANSFSSLDEFRTYASTRLPSITWWESASDDTLIAAKIYSTRLLSSCVDWTGLASSESQSLSWPRNGMFNRNGFVIPGNVIPSELKNADCELALLSGAEGTDLTSTNDALKLGVSGVNAKGVSVTFQDLDLSTKEAVDMVIKRQGPEYDYLNVLPLSVRLLLVPSWYKRKPIRTQPTLWIFG